MHLNGSEYGNGAGKNSASFIFVDLISTKKGSVSEIHKSRILEPNNPNTLLNHKKINSFFNFPDAVLASPYLSWKPLKRRTCTTASRIYRAKTDLEREFFAFDLIKNYLPENPTTPEDCNDEIQKVITIHKRKSK